jgi:hypothetical protein
LNASNALERGARRLACCDMRRYDIRRCRDYS